MTETPRIAIIGSGALGGAIARRWLATGCVTPDRLTVVSRSATPLAGAPEVAATADAATLCAAADVVLLAVPPAQAQTLHLGASRALVLSVMAGVTLQHLGRITGHGRIVRAMSSPAAERGLAWSPWLAPSELARDDRRLTRHLLSVLGETAEVAQEAHIDHFTALTGPVPGFVAAVAAAMIDHSVAQGLDRTTAERAVRQLFLAAGLAMAEAADSPADQVQAMIDYDGTTAAGLRVLRDGPVARALAEALEAAAKRARHTA
jgi:pyrroline-5-carboxylate reductase